MSDRLQIAWRHSAAWRNESVSDFIISKRMTNVTEISRFTFWGCVSENQQPQRERGACLGVVTDSLSKLLEANGSFLCRRPIDSLPHMAVPGVGLTMENHKIRVDEEEVGLFICLIMIY